MSLVIVGNGMVSARLCELLARSGVTVKQQVIVLGDEGIPAYDRVRLSELFATSRGPESFLIRTASWYERSRIQLHTKERVQRIDREERCVETESGRRILYSQLVLATGAAAARPPIQGIHAPAIQVYRSAADREAIERGIRPGARVAILGGELLGLELAEALARRGCDVSLLEQAPRLLPRHLDARAATIVADRADMLGIRVRCGTRVVRVDASHGSARLHLDDAETIDAELVVVATGVRPRHAASARSAGCARSRRRRRLEPSRSAPALVHLREGGAPLRRKAQSDPMKNPIPT